jgi:hypothetical protein
MSHPLAHAIIYDMELALMIVSGLSFADKMALAKTSIAMRRFVQKWFETNINLVVSKFLGKLYYRFWGIFLETNACFVGSVCQRIISPTEDWEPRDINILVSKEFQSVWANWIDNHEEDMKDAPFKICKIRYSGCVKDFVQFQVFNVSLQHLSVFAC